MLRCPRGDAQLVIEDMEHDEPLDPWVERARQLRLAWMSEQRGALARALRHAPNDGGSGGDGALDAGHGAALLKGSS